MTDVTVKTNNCLLSTSIFVARIREMFMDEVKNQYQWKETTGDRPRSIPEQRGMARDTREGEMARQRLPQNLIVVCPQGHFYVPSP
jgi:hypothetical protein